MSSRKLIPNSLYLLIALLLSCAGFRFNLFPTTLKRMGMVPMKLVAQPAQPIRIDLTMEQAINNCDYEVKSVDQEGLVKISDHFVNGSDVRIGIIMARENANIVENLYASVNKSLIECGVQSSNVFTMSVPSCFDLPITARLLAASRRVDVIIAVGCMIKAKGGAVHFEKVSEAVTDGLMKVGLDTMVPCIHGVLSVPRRSHLILTTTPTSTSSPIITSPSPSSARSSSGAHDHHSSSNARKLVNSSNEGLKWARAAVEMGLNRMSALGLDKKTKTKQGDSSLKEESDATEFVTFRRSAVAQSSDKKEPKSTSSTKKIGF